MPGIEGGPSILDHSFNHSAISYSLTNFIEPAIAGKNPDWTPAMVREKARKEMAYSLLESREYVRMERNRQEVIPKAWEIVETSAGKFELTAKWGGQQFTLQELWEHTKKTANDESNPKTYNPGAYNQAEADAQLAIQDALISGRATAAVTMISDVDSYRYVQIWEKKEGGVIEAKVIDVGLFAGRDFLDNEASVIMQGIADFYSEKRDTFNSPSEHPHFMVGNGLVNENDIKTIARAQVAAISLSKPIVDNVAMQTAETISYVHYRVIDEFYLTGRRVREYIDSKSFREESLVPKELINDLIVHMDTDQRSRILVNIDEQKISGMSDEEIIQLWQMRVREVFNISAEKSEEVFIELQKMFRSMENTKAIINFLVTPDMQDVGMPAAFVALEMLAHPEKFTEETSVEQGVLVLSPEHWEAIINFLSVDLSLPDSLSVDVSGGELIQGLEFLDMTVLTWVKGLVERLDQESPEKIMEILEHEEEITILKLSDAWEIFIELIHKKEPVSGMQTEKKITEKIKKEREHVRQYSFAFTLWTLLKFHGYYRSITVLKDVVTSEKYKGLSIFEKIKLLKPEGIIQAESTQWLLLAIIWHLAMLREAGVYQSTAAKQKKKKKKQSVILYDFNYSFEAHRDMIKVRI